MLNVSSRVIPTGDIRPTPSAVSRLLVMHILELPYLEGVSGQFVTVMFVFEPLFVDYFVLDVSIGISTRGRTERAGVEGKFLYLMHYNQQYLEPNSKKAGYMNL